MAKLLLLFLALSALLLQITRRIASEYKLPSQLPAPIGHVTEYLVPGLMCLVYIWVEQVTDSVETAGFIFGAMTLITSLMVLRWTLKMGVARSEQTARIRNLSSNQMD